MKVIQLTSEGNAEREVSQILRQHDLPERDESGGKLRSNENIYLYKTGTKGVREERYPRTFFPSTGVWEGFLF